MRELKQALFSIIRGVGSRLELTEVGKNEQTL